MKNFPLYVPRTLVLLVCLFVLASSSPCLAQSGGTRPHEVAVRNGDVIATSLGSNSVRLLRAGTTSPIEVAVGAPSWGVCVVGDSAYVTMPSIDEIAVIDLSGTGTVPPPTYLTVPYGCTEILSDEDGDYLYVANVGVPYSTDPEKEWTHSILKIDRLSPQSRIQFETERQPRALALSPDGERLFVGTVQGALGQQGLGTQVPAGSGFTAPHDGGSILIHDTSNPTYPTRIAVGSPVRGLAVLPDAVYASEGSGQYRIYFTHVGEGVQSEDPEHGGRAIPNVISSVLMDSDHEPLERQDAIFRHWPDHEPVASVTNANLPAVIPERVVVRPESVDEEYAAELWVTHSASGTLSRAWIAQDTGRIAASGDTTLTFPAVDSVMEHTYGYVFSQHSITYDRISPADHVRTDAETTMSERFRSRPRGIAIDETTGFVVVVTEFRSDAVFFDANAASFASVTPDSVQSIGSKISQYGRSSVGEGNFFTFGEGFDFREVVAPNAARVNNISCGTCHVDGHIDGKVRLTVRVSPNMADLAGEDRMVVAVPSMKDVQATEWIFFEGLRTIEDRASEVPGCGYCGRIDIFLNTTSFAPGTSRTPHSHSSQLSESASRGRAWFDDMNCSRCHSGRAESFLRTTVATIPIGFRSGPLEFNRRMLSDPTQVFIEDSSFDRASLRNMVDVGTRLEDAGATISPDANTFVPGINTPALAGVWDNRPYLHDGRYRTLDEVLEHTWIQSSLGNRAARLWGPSTVPDNLFDSEAHPVTSTALPRIEAVEGGFLVGTADTLQVAAFRTHAHADPDSTGTEYRSVRDHLGSESYSDLLSFLRVLSSQYDPYPDANPPAVANLTVEPGPDNDVTLSWNTPQLTVCRVHADNDITSATLDTLSLGASHAVTLTLPNDGRWTFTVQSAYRGQIATASVEWQALPILVNLSDATGLTLPQGSQPYSSIPLDFDDDGDEDLLISFEDRRATLNRSTVGESEAPVFLNVAFTLLGDGSVENTRGLTAADFTGNGFVDLFIAAADSNLFLFNDAPAGDPGFSGSGSDQSALLGAARTLPAVGASFGDFDGDGWLDLYVMSDSTGTGDVLLHSSGGAGLTDVTEDAGITTGLTRSTSAVWADLDLDGRLDLVVGWGVAVGSGSQRTRYYRNEGRDPNSGTVTFTDVAGAATGPRMGVYGHIQSIVAADISGDGILDLVLASHAPADTTHLITLVNDGQGVLTQQVIGGLAQQPGLVDLVVTDLSGSGVPDLVAVPEGNASVLVLRGYGDATSRGFRDFSQTAALGSDVAHGLVMADFNRDTDIDLFLLRPQTGSDPQDKKFYWSNSLVDPASPPSSPRAFTVTLDGGDAAHYRNTRGVGAQVAVEVDGPGAQVLRTVQVVDGGSGRLRQGPLRLAYGLAGANTAEIKVRWPHGQTQIFDAASSPGFPHVVLTDTSNPLLHSSTVQSSYVPSSGYTVIVFTWECTYPVGTPQVLIVAPSKAPASCKVPLNNESEILLDPSMSEVTASSVYDGERWIHTLSWIAYCAPDCTYTYTTRNVAGGVVYSSSPKTLNVSVCADITE